MDAIADRVQETTTTSGTGNITLAGAVAGFQTFNTAFGTSKFFRYAVTDGNAWETGQGYLSNSTTLVRNQVWYSTNSNNALNLSGGTSNVFCSLTGKGDLQMTGKILAMRSNSPMP
ncbi:MAG TPA: hypothetical protein VFQ99_05115 [Gallionella sp.]|nr:hypothetical protein [Gallionella sp.]